MTDQYYMYLLEVGGIQDFIFSSNNLQVNIGASGLVRAVTDIWIKEILNDKKTNFKDTGDASSHEFIKVSIENDNLDAEIIYIGGGNALILFRDELFIEKFTRSLTRKRLLEAPGINLTFSYLPFSLKMDDIREKYSALRKELSIKKTKEVPHPSIMSFGVTARCVYSGKPAAGLWKDPGSKSKLVSQEVMTKLENFPQGNRYLDQLVQGLEMKSKYEFITNFDDFGEKGTSSYIAIVHADGNRMGERIKALGNGLDLPKDNRKYIEILRAFSQSSKDAATNALRLTITKLVNSIQNDNGVQIIRRKNEVSDDQLQSLPKVIIKNNKIPFRPIVFGGDDVTFVCDGRLGLALAKEYLTNYGNQDLEEGRDVKEKAVGRAGIAITPSHFPFSRGYELAEELSGYAKLVGEDGKKQSLDWHFGTNGIVESIKDIRQRGYKVNENDLTMRPVRLSDPTEYDFETFEFLIKEFQVGEKWASRRNKVKALPGLLREDGAKLSAFLDNARLPDLPADSKLKQISGLTRQGWAGAKCYYFDALEAIDFHIPLE